jgi:ribosomal protein S18 acetylase RimI-like enzyme
MVTTIELRPVSAQDAAELQKTCWPNWSVDSVKEMLRRAEDLSRKGRGLGVVACHSGELVAYGQLTVWPRTTEISDLMVAENHRSQGIGSAIIASLIDKAKHWHMPKIEIGVALTNPRAMALYQRLGFEEDRIVNIDLGDGPEPVMYLTMNLPA